MRPWPPVMGSWMVGADWTMSSRTMANCLPTLAELHVANFVRAVRLQREADGRPVRLVDGGVSRRELVAAE